MQPRHRTWILRGPGGERLLVQPEGAPRHPRHERVPPAFVRAWLDGWVLDPVTCAALLDLHAAYAGSLGVLSWGPDRVDDLLRASLASAFERGDPVVLMERSPAAARPGRGEEPPPSGPPPSPPPPRGPKTFIEIQLLDEQGAPVRGVPYRITLPDGSVRTGALDAEGLARFDGIDPGECDIELPAIDGREWGRTLGGPSG